MADQNLPYQDPTTISRRLDAEIVAGYDGNNVYRERIIITGGTATTAAELNAGESVGALRVIHASDAIASTQTKFISRTTNPTAIADGSAAFGSSDDLGRQVTRPVQVRDLLATAYATLSTGTETTVLAAGGAGVFNDCISVMCANTSGAAIQVDFRAVTAGSVEFTVEVPASGTAGIVFQVPWPQGNANNNWTADMGDFSNTTVYVSGMFTKEI